jgi:hypothetical protein
MKILFDKGSSQVQVQLEAGNRLNTLFGAIEAQGWSQAIGPDRIDSKALEGIQCLVILTRHRATQRGKTNPFPADWDFAYTEEELEVIENFVVVDGGGLLLISNHGPFGLGDADWTVNDRVLAARFGVSINPAAYQSPNPPLTMSGTDLGTGPAVQPILDGVTSIVVHNSCAVSMADPQQSIAIIPPNAFNTSPTFPEGPAGQNYAVLGKPNGRGRLIVAGNSGLAGDPESSYPAPGLIDVGSNKQFLLNAMRFLGTM